MNNHVKNKIDEISSFLKKDVSTAPVSVQKKTRTNEQNRALHLDCKFIADKLNDAGKDMRLVLKPSYLIPWTTESVKEHIFKPVMKAMFQHTSTKDLSKTYEIDKIHEVIMRELGEKHGIDWHDFPNDPDKISNYPSFNGKLDT